MDFDNTHGSPEENERREIVQDIIDRILYVPGFKEKVVELIKSTELPSNRKIKRSPLEFNHS